jgi:hypothetical protein
MLFLDYLIQGIAGKGNGYSGRVAVPPPPHAAESDGGKMGRNIKILKGKLISCTQEF